MDIQEALQHVFCHIPKGSTIAVGLSGGVDSSLSAALLKELGYNVFGVFMKNWEEEGYCTVEEDFKDVSRIAKALNIPYYTINFAKEYREEIFQDFLKDLQQGLTPNPDILCNREIKFKRLLQKALSLGGDALATGHYATNHPQDGQFFLKRSRDQSKDQTYFLYTATQESLSKTCFPLANFLKSEVRALAKAFNIPVHEKKDSTGICFIGERNFKQFLASHIGYNEGPMVTIDGKMIGKHIGLAYYTIGQRKGLKIGGEGKAWFVVDKCVPENKLIVAQGEDHPALFAYTLDAKDPHWILGQPPLFPKTCTAKIRYRQADQACVVDQKGSSLHVSFSLPQRAITPEQSIVFYDGDICLGGAFITKRGPSLFESKTL